jgi:prolyl oligopeptidase
MMRTHSAAILLAVFVSLPAPAQWQYPRTPTSDAVDVWYGKRYLDPYRPLENTKDKEVEAWFKSQATLTDGLLSRLPGRDVLVREWVELDKRTPPRYRQIRVKKGQVFYRKTIGGENVGKLYVRDGYEGSEQLLFDPTSYTPHANTVVTFFVPSFDAKHVLLGLSAEGAEWSELRVLRVADRVLLPETIPAVGWFGAGWLPGDLSFTYSGSDITDLKNPNIELNRQVRVHRLGTPVNTDRDILSDASTPEVDIAPKEIPVAEFLEVQPDRLFGFLATVQPEVRLYTAPISEVGKQKIAWKSVAQPADGLVRGMVVSGGWLYAVTYTGAPHYRVVRSRLDAPDWKKAETVIPEAGDSIEGITQSKDFMLVQYSNGITGRVVQYQLASGATREVKLPTSGTVDVTCPDAHSNRCLIAVDGWVQPEVLYELDADTGTVKKSSLNTDVEYPEFADVVSEEVEIPGQDGAMIPLSILHRKDLPMDGSSPCILEGYGAYGISYTPYFDIKHSVVAHGVVFAYAHVRGGSEKGDAWYKAGYKTTKPNTWRDFISAGEYLVAKGYTSTKHLTGRGTSAGGILISRAMTERPDLFSAAVVNVGVANALRAEFSANGPVNTPEFGTVKDPVEAQALFEMDGLQHVQPGVRYPAVLGVAGWNDPRVAAWLPGKFIAAVQQASTSGRPALLLVNYDNGHFTEEKRVTFRNFANQYAFALWQAGHKGFQPRPTAKTVKEPGKAR